MQSLQDPVKLVALSHRQADISTSWFSTRLQELRRWSKGSELKYYEKERECCRVQHKHLLSVFTLIYLEKVIYFYHRIQEGKLV